MSEACGSTVAESSNPGLILGAALAELTLAKRDKVTFLCSPSLAAFPSWLEQLIAESTGKERKGIVPVANESIGPPEKYSSDRTFVYLRLEGDENHHLDRQAAALEANGHPLVRIDFSNRKDLGQEFFRWEIAVAAAGAALGINPFNQPDVQLAKDLARQAMEKRSGSNAARARKDEVAVAERETCFEALGAWLAKKRPRDYVAVQAYLSPSPEHAAALDEICTSVRERLGAAVTLGFGPRFLHSTGQLHKGGPNSVLALQIIDQPADNLLVPETNYTFDALIEAQATGDFTALKQRRRRALRVNVGTDAHAGLKSLAEAVRG
jgi:transaldolase/glucose-6-phosphate isomerase